MALKGNLIANYLGQGWAALMSLAFVPLYIKYLGIESYGLVGIFAVLQAWLGLLDMGMTPTLVREMARFTGGIQSNESIRDLLRSIEIIAAGFAILTAGGVAMGSNWIATSWLKANALPVDVVAQAMCIMGLVTALRFVEGVYRSAIVGLQRQVLLNVLNSVMATLRGFGAVGVLVWISPTIRVFFLWQAIVSILTLLTFIGATYASISGGRRGGRFSFEALRSVWRFSIGMASISCLAILLTQIDKVLLSRLLPLKEFGYYTLAGALAGSINMLIVPIFQAFYPKFCELYANGDTVALSHSFHKSAQLVSVVAGSASIVLIFFAETFLRLWTQESSLAENIAVLMSLLTMGNLLSGIIGIPYHMQLAHGWLRLAIYILLVEMLVFVPAILWIVPRHGAVGAAWVWVALNVGYVLIPVHLIFQRIMTMEKWRWYREDVLAPLVAAGLAAGLIKYFWPVQEAVILQVLMLGVASIVALIASGLASRHVRQQMQFVLKSVLSKFIAKSYFH